MRRYTYEQKRQMYINGEHAYHLVPVIIASWTIDDWIKFIDDTNGWRPSK